MNYSTQPLHRSGRFLVTALLAGLVLVSLSGCGAKTDGAASSAQQSSSATAESQTKAIQDNTHMPPEAKAAALQSIQQHQASGPAMRQANGAK